SAGLSTSPSPSREHLEVAHRSSLSEAQPCRESLLDRHDGDAIPRSIARDKPWQTSRQSDPRAGRQSKVSGSSSTAKAYRLHSEGKSSPISAPTLSRSSPPREIRSDAAARFPRASRIQKRAAPSSI